MAAGSYLTLSWLDFWGWYLKNSEVNQSLLLEQLDLPDMLKFASPKVRDEVLEGAPQHIREAIVSGNDEKAMHVKPTRRDKLIDEIWGRWPH